jgi:hypothetical protein
MFESEASGREGDGSVEIRDIAELLADRMENRE